MAKKHTKKGVEVKILSAEESKHKPMSDAEYEKHVDEISMQADMALAAELRTRRKALGWTQTELARELDISQPHLSNWERGVWSPPMYIFLALDAIEFRDVIEEAKKRKK
jgi:DNA-binding transcriptional regulator YiaG